ncbi:unnamed protein product [Ceutorhynchus assimilis]|uniref:2',5'-phosphodiesterase 12 n=1 Tax=Ceutorhynchus assimilis TaxID=467358 RepID=A0A9N9MR63_9CUCU|nr:unnamed protein product [Ceutorhynchus assimilis]
MDKAYLRHNPDGEHFDITFELHGEGIKRKFNLTRKLSESVDSFLTRVKANVDKAVNKKKKRKSTSTDDKPLSITLLSNKIEIPKDQSCQEVFYSDNPVQLSINEQAFDVIINSPWVLTLTLPNSILANFPIYPAKFESVFTNTDNSDFLWYKSQDKIEWQKAGKGFIYQPQNTDINCYLKFVCVPRNDDSMAGPEFEAISSCVVQASPGECPFERRHAFTKNKLKGNEFRVVSYNILADLYCDSDYSRKELFPYCPPYALSIDYRKQLFLKEIIGYNADIVCLQEVDRKVFKYDLKPTLSHLGYESNFDLKGNGAVAEGLAFFYNTSRFILLGHEEIFFADQIKTNPLFEDIWGKIKRNEKLASRISDRTTTMQVNVVGSLENNEVLVVANTHLYFHPDADHIRLLHGCLAIRYLENFVKETKKRYCDKRVSLIFCGDFNSVPTCGIYKLYTTGFLPGNFPDYSSNQEESINNINMKQSFKLQSACGTPKYTNFTVIFAACLDYIFYEETNLAVSQVIPLPSEEELIENSAIPSVVFPSDHVALVSDLKWI